MRLIDKYLPQYSFSEVHSREVAAPPEVVIDAAANYRSDADPFFRNMIGLRELPMRIANGFRGERAETARPFGLHNFTLLEKQDGKELVYGLIGRFWRPDFGLVAVADGQAFRNFETPGIAKLAMCFYVMPQGPAATVLITETRVFCPDRACRLKFAPYWYLIRPVSGLIRRRTLDTIRKASESRLHSDPRHENG